MGNRAAVVFTDKSAKQISPAVYLHWNGGPESIYAFLDELRRRGCNGHSVSYTAARFTHVVGDYFESDGAGSQCLGIEAPPDEISPEGLSQLANVADDNGVYVVSPGDDKTWNVRRFMVSVATDMVREWTKRQVTAERKEAYQHDYRTKSPSIVEALCRTRPFLENQAVTMKSAKHLTPDTPLPIAADWIEEHGDRETAEKVRATYQPKGRP